MKDMFGRRPPLLVDVSPPAAAPGEFVDAQIVARRPVDRVSAAHVSGGYTNFYPLPLGGSDRLGDGADQRFALVGRSGLCRQHR